MSRLLYHVIPICYHAIFPLQQDPQYTKDTHVDLAMDMWITHNKSRVAYSTKKYTYPTTPAPRVYEQAECLITYYGYTNATCWYASYSQPTVRLTQKSNLLGNFHIKSNSIATARKCNLTVPRYETRGDSAEAGASGTLGHHLVEAHWKYFTIRVKDAGECDKAAHLHYEFLLNRCSPKHHLPVVSMFRPNAAAKELTTHIYPKPNIPQPGQTNR